MRTVTIQTTSGTPVKVSENDFLIAAIDYLRKNFKKDECVVKEITRKGNVTTEKPVAVFALLRNPEMVNHYNKTVKREV